jgi:hypothetical protein
VTRGFAVRGFAVRVHELTNSRTREPTN